MTVYRVYCFVPTSHLVEDAKLNGWAARLSNAPTITTLKFRDFLPRPGTAGTDISIAARVLVPTRAGAAGGS